MNLLTILCIFPYVISEQNPANELEISIEQVKIVTDTVHDKLEPHRRVKRQFQTKFDRKIPDLSGIEQGCKTTGYETREREICEEIQERVCVVNKE